MTSEGVLVASLPKETNISNNLKTVEEVFQLL